MERDAIEPSGLVTPPSHSPVNDSWTAKLEAVGVGDKDVGDDAAGVAVGEEQADSTESSRRVDMKRMRPNIMEPIQQIALQMEGSKKDPSGEGLEKIQLARFSCGLRTIMHAKFAKDLPGIPTHCAHRQHTRVRNLGVRVTQCH